MNIKWVNFFFFAKNLPRRNGEFCEDINEI